MSNIYTTRTPQWVLDAMEVRSRTDVHGKHADFEGCFMTYEKLDDEEAIRVLSFYFDDDERSKIPVYLDQTYSFGHSHFRIDFTVLAEHANVKIVYLGTTKYIIKFEGEDE